MRRGGAGAGGGSSAEAGQRWRHRQGAHSSELQASSPASHESFEALCCKDAELQGKESRVREGGGLIDSPVWEG